MPDSGSSGPGRPHNYMRIQFDDDELYEDPSKLPDYASDEDKIKEQLTRRLTPRSRAYITRLIVEGKTNKEINRKLRMMNYLSMTSPDVSRDVLRKLRRGPYAKRIPGLLEADAQFIAHQSLSRAVYYMSDVLDHAYQRVVDGIETDPKTGSILSPAGLIFGIDTKLSEVRSIMADAIKLLYSWYAKDIAKYTDSIGDDTKGITTEDGKSQIEIMDSMLASLIREKMSMERRRYEAAGIKVPDFGSGAQSAAVSSAPTSESEPNTDSADNVHGPSSVDEAETARQQRLIKKKRELGLID